MEPFRPFFAPVEPIPPKIEDLKIKSLKEDSVIIRWLAPGKVPVPSYEKCFYDKKAKNYIVRFGNLRITDDSWDDESLNAAGPIPTPAEKGSIEELVLTNLTPDTQYNLGIRYAIKNVCTNELETSQLSVISFETLEKKEAKLVPTPLKLGSLRRDGYQVVPILVYHNITEIPKRSTDVSLDNFYNQMKYLSDNGYTTITTKQLYNFLNVRSRIPRKSVILTFDDGYQSMHKLVNKILKEFNFRGVIFIYTNAVVGRYGSTMTWDQIKKVGNDAFEIQMHTKTHSQDLAYKKEDETGEKYLERLDTELLSSRNLVEEKIGKKVEYLAYPYGIFSEELVALLRDRYNYKGAFTVIGSTKETNDAEKYVVEYGYNTFFTNPFKIRRAQILRNTGLNKFKRYLRSFKQEDIIDKKIIKNLDHEINSLK
jgi:peptidoglycan/xylan/chitin deacetylase (PgdA/CDA1 family)